MAGVKRVTGSRDRQDRQVYLISYGDLRDVLEDEVDYYDTLSLDNPADRKRFVEAILRSITTAAEAL